MKNFDIIYRTLGDLYFRVGFGKKMESLRKIGYSSDCGQRNKSYRSSCNFIEPLATRSGDKVDEFSFGEYFREHNYKDGKSHEVFIYHPSLLPKFNSIKYKSLYTSLLNDLFSSYIFNRRDKTFNLRSGDYIFPDDLWLSKPNCKCCSLWRGMIYKYGNSIGEILDKTNNEDDPKLLRYLHNKLRCIHEYFESYISSKDILRIVEALYLSSLTTIDQDYINSCRSSISSYLGVKL